MAQSNLSDESSRLAGHPRSMANRVLLYTAGLALGAVLFAAFLAYGDQLREGLGVSGKNWPVMWSIYITDFVFWSGMGQGCMILTVLIRFVYRKRDNPLTFGGDFLALAALLVGSLFPLIHLGRPSRFYWLMPLPNERMLFPNLASPLMWDFVTLNSLIVVALLYVCLHRLQDFATLSGRAKGLLRLGRFCAATLVVVLALAANVTESSIFAHTPNPVWESPTTRLHFFVAALFSGFAALTLFSGIVCGVVRPRERTPFPTRTALLSFSFVWACLTAAEGIRLLRVGGTAGLAVLQSKLHGEYALPFWATVVLCFVLPSALLSTRRLGSAVGNWVASLILIGLWLDRFVLIVPTLAHPRLAVSAVYSPTTVESVITAGSAAAVILVCAATIRFLPGSPAPETGGRE